MASTDTSNDRDDELPEFNCRVFAGCICPRCGQADGIAVNLRNISFTCNECSEDFTIADVRKMIGVWTKVLEWVEWADRDAAE